jgi:hypothetical protein
MTENYLATKENDQRHSGAFLWKIGQIIQDMKYANKKIIPDFKNDEIIVLFSDKSNCLVKITAHNDPIEIILIYDHFISERSTLFLNIDEGNKIPRYELERMIENKLEHLLYR